MQVFDKLNDMEAVSIKIFQGLLRVGIMKSDFIFTSITITKFETSGCWSLGVQINATEDATVAINGVNLVKKKF